MQMHETLVTSKLQQYDNKRAFLTLEGLHDIM